MQFFPPAAPLPRVRAQRGVSAVELVLGVAALAAAATAGMHSLARISADVSVRDQAAALQSALNFARNEAIRLHASVDVVPVDEDWSRGWTIQVRESEAVIRRDGPLARDIAPMRAEAIGFLRNGLVRGEGAPTQSLQLASSSTAARLHCVEFRVTGAPIMRVDKDGDGRCDVD